MAKWRAFIDVRDEATGQRRSVALGYTASEQQAAERVSAAAYLLKDRCGAPRHSCIVFSPRPQACGALRGEAVVFQSASLGGAGAQQPGVVAQMTLAWHCCGAASSVRAAAGLRARRGRGPERVRRCVCLLRCVRAGWRRARRSSATPTSRPIKVRATDHADAPALALLQQHASECRTAAAVVAECEIARTGAALLFRCASVFVAAAEEQTRLRSCAWCCRARQGGRWRWRRWARPRSRCWRTCCRTR